jgi:hypothetical protein
MARVEHRAGMRPEMKPKERADRQRTAWRRMYECNCGVERGNHKIGCPKAK